MPHFAVSCIGADQPGIVAAVTGVLVDHGCNLEDTSMSILRGHFAMMLVVAGPADLGSSTLEAALAEPSRRFELVTVVRTIDDEVPSSPPGEPWSVSVYGADRPGIVHRVTALMADAGVNVVDLATRVIGDPTRPVYAMMLDVTLPWDLPGAELDRRLAGLAVELGVECSTRPADADIL
ncbi:MAG: glycine cleavage system protein R [Acidimicrobiales bacterium]